MSIIFYHVLKMLRDRSANVAILTAMSLLPIMGMIGLSIDYAIAISTKSKLDTAADAAAVAAITKAQSVIVGNLGVTGTALTDGQTQGQAAFRANAGSMSFTTVPAPVVSVTRTGQTLASTVSYQTTDNTTFGRIFGASQWNTSGTSSASLAMPSYINIYVVLDVSSSMGIGATQSDQQIAYTATGGCAVACHYTGTTTQARNAGATLRIDVAKQALVAALQQIQNSGTYAQVAIYTMSDQFINIYQLSGNIAGAITAVNTIDISNSNNDGGTDTTYALNQLASAIPTSGDGLSKATAKGIVMLITDGVQDSDMKKYSNGNWNDSSDPNFTVYSPCVTSTCQYQSAFGIYVEAFDPSQCASIKNKGYTMTTLEVKYLIPPTNLQSTTSSLNAVFSYIQQYLLQSIPTNMSACATSSSYAYSASTPAEISAAMAQMFATTVSAARLTH